MSVRVALFLTILALPLGGCLTLSEVKQRPGVEEAKACMKALQTDRMALPGFVINACTSNGVWLADQIDETGAVLARYDFVNGEYGGADTGFGMVPVESLGESQIDAFKTMRQTLNQDLRKKI